jgi:peroxiredoxin Q/BCP
MLKTIIAGFSAALAFAVIGGEARAHPEGHDFFPPPPPAQQSSAELGPKVGAAIPHDLAATDATGKARDFGSLVGEKGMALFFVRSVDWCPYCKAQTLSVDAARAEFEKRGLSVVFVSYDAVERQKAFANARKVSVTLLSDPKSEIIDAFGLRNEKHTSGRFAGIPHPAAFIVKPDRAIAAKLYETDYETNDVSYASRPEVAAILAAADAALK